MEYRRIGKGVLWQDLSPLISDFALGPTTDSPKPQLLTRSLAARMMAKWMGWAAEDSKSRYVDLSPGSPEQRAAEALSANGIDSRLWDGETAFAPEGKLFFKPDAPITRAQFAELLFLAHLHIGPLWFDHPADLKSFPPAL
jgi:hypothetical protein